MSNAKEIGGYIELDRYHLPMQHEGAIALNCGRNAVAYLIEAKNIKHICMPIYMCESVKNLIRKYRIQLSFYSIADDFTPVEPELDDSTWIYVVNFYGQLSRQKLQQLSEKYPRMILDNCHTYFAEPLEGVDTLYSCRKILGVPDGAFLYTNAQIQRELPQEESFDRMRYLMGRFERNASEFYKESADNNEFFIEEPLKRMSKLTDNLLHAIDYSYVRQRRTENYEFLRKEFEEINQIKAASVDGGFMFPLKVDNAMAIKKAMAALKIYIPTLWPNVLEEAEEGTSDYRLAHDILPLPCDQRYDLEDMKKMTDAIKNCMKEM